MSRFSIIIPVYNVAPYLHECLDSVLAQTCTDWETICVDDGSTDGSGSILDEYAGKDARFRVIHQANAGVGPARNRALKCVKGEWIFFLDGDDVVAPRWLEQVDGSISLFPEAELVHFGMVKFDGGEKSNVASSIETTLRQEKRNISSFIPMDVFISYFWQYAYRRPSVKNVSFPSYIRGEDRVFLAEILLHRTNSYVNSNVVLYGYRQRSGSAMNSIPDTKVLIDEMLHRRDIVCMIEASGKTVPYAGSWWLEGYFTDSFARWASSKSAEERRELWWKWYQCVRDMKDAHGLSNRTRRIYRLACLLPCRPVWWFLVRFLSWYHRHGILPRIARRIKV